MIRLNINNINDFLETVNECSGAVNLLHQDGTKININKDFSVQNELLEHYRKNKNYLKVSLDIPVPQDYMDIILFTIGDC